MQMCVGLWQYRWRRLVSISALVSISIVPAFPTLWTQTPVNSLSCHEVSQVCLRPSTQLTCMALIC